MSPTRRILVALVAGLAVGVASLAVPALAPLPALVAPVGQLWLRGLQMEIVPLVVALLVTGICSAAPTGTLGRQAARLLGLFAGLLLAAGTLAAVLLSLLLPLLPIPAMARAGTAGAPASAATNGPTAWIDAVLPLNPVRAAADGAMLPLVVFVLLFALALARVAPESREVAVRFFRAIADAMLVLVGWVLALAPIGVFAIVVSMVAGFGSGAAAGAVAYYVALTSANLLLVTLLVHPLGARATRRSLGAFSRALLPAQTIAATTRSSVASLPAMLDASRALGTSGATAGFALPLAVTLFRITTPPAAMTTALFVAHVHGIPLDVGTIALLVLASVVLSAGVVGVPGQASYFVTRLPMFAIAGLPIDLLGALLAVDMIPDVFRTVGNVTADVTVAAMVDPRERATAEAVGVGAPEGAYATNMTEPVGS